jgi:hypothetical protein
VLFEHVTQRVEIERIELIGQRHPQHHVRHQVHRRLIQGIVVVQEFLPRQLAKRVAHFGRTGDVVPEFAQCRARALRAALHEAMDKRRRVHGSCGGRADAFHCKPAVFQQPVEHAPCKRAMRATAL